MDVFIADRVSLKITIAAFRIAAAHYLMSDHHIATTARNLLEKSTRGTDSFFAALNQDLDSVHTSLEQLWSSTQRVDQGDARRDLRNLLLWLAILLREKDKQQMACAAPLSADDSERLLRALCHRCLTWNLDALEPARIEWVSRQVDLSDPPLRLREGVKRAFEAVLQHIQPVGPTVSRTEQGAPDTWALGVATRLCTSLRSVHKELLGEWFCECPISHAKVLTSFAIPCFTSDSDVHCTLRFPSGQSCNTVFLDVVDDFPRESVPDSVVSDHTSDLHNELARFAEQSVTTTTLTFSTMVNRWTLVKGDQSLARQSDMVALADLIADGGLREQSPYIHRVALALIICYAFLELGDTPWLPYTTDHINIWLPHEAGSAPDLLHPYIEVGLDSSNHIIDDSQFVLLGLINGEMPCLPLLGKLIFELISGESIEKIEHVGRHMTHYHSQYPERAPHLSMAVWSCMRDKDFKQGVLKDNKKLRLAFFQRVINELHALLKNADQTLESIMTSGKGVTPHSLRVADKIASGLHRTTWREKQSAGGNAGGSKSKHCLHDNGYHISYDSDRAHKADHFLREMDEVHEYIRATGSACRPVRIAIIDTGAHFDTCARNSFGPRLQECRSWLHPKQDSRGTNHPRGTDHDGHGTHCTSTILRCAPEDCEVYVAQVFADHAKCSLASEREAGTNFRVAQAIEYAVDDWNVDIISMSFGFEGEDEVIEAALKKADQNDVLLLAAASNVGRDMVGAHSWPAATRDNVMCIYATEGKGLPYTENPTWCKDSHRLATLGVMVPVWSPPGDDATPRITHRSGTSIATPVAAGVAACILNFVWRSKDIYLSTTASNDENASERFRQAKRRLQKARGMGEIFFKQMTDRDNKTEYHFVHPWKLFDRETTATTLIENIVNCLVPHKL